MIIILTQCFPSRLGGIESLVSNLALGLTKQDKVIVFADRHHIFYDAIFDNQNKEKILVRRTGGLKFFRRRKKIKEIKPLIESNQVKLVIGDSWKSLELGIDYLYKKNINTVCLAHGNEIISQDVNKINRIKHTFNKTNTIIANSFYTSKLLERVADNNKIITVYPGANDLRFFKEDKFIEIKGSPILLTLGRLEKRKGHLRVLKALLEIRKQYFDIKYIIAGEGTEKRNLKNFVKKNNLTNNVFFVGSVNDSQKKYLYTIANFMVMPTLDEEKNSSIEGFGIVYLEAAFFSVPSIASKVGGTAEAVMNEKTGLIIENESQLIEAIFRLIRDKKKLFELGKNAQKRAIEKFKWENVINNYLKFFKINI